MYSNFESWFNWLGYCSLLRTHILVIWFDYMHIAYITLATVLVYYSSGNIYFIIVAPYCNNKSKNMYDRTLSNLSIKFFKKLVFWNLFWLLLSDQGVPMILMGDEYGHTKGGNNNTYCHDNYVVPLSCFILNFFLLLKIQFCWPELLTLLQLNYFRWDKLEESSSDFHRFCSLMTTFR